MFSFESGAVLDIINYECQTQKSIKNSNPFCDVIDFSLEYQAVHQIHMSDSRNKMLNKNDTIL